MSEEEHHHHGLFGHHHHEKHGEEAVNKPVSHFDEYPEAEEDAIPIERTEYYEGPAPSAASASSASHRAHGSVHQEGGEDDAKKHEKSAAHKEHVGEALGAAAAAFALHERQKASKDPEHAGRHKLEERIAEAVAVGAGGYALHEHHEKNEAKKEEQQHEGGEEHAKKHHFF